MRKVGFSWQLVGRRELRKVHLCRYDEVLLYSTENSVQSLVTENDGRGCSCCGSVGYD